MNSNCRIQGVIFDMDGVLLDSEPIHVRSWEHVLSGLKIKLDHNWFLPWVGIPDEKVAEFFAGMHSDIVDKATILSRKRNAYLRMIEQEAVPYPGVKEGLTKLNGIPKAVASNSLRHDVEFTLAAIKLSSLLPALITADDVTNRKPHPEPFIKAAELMRVPMSACAVIEDSPVGIEAARAAGAFAIAVMTTHFADALGKVDAIFTTTADALTWIIEQEKDCS